MYHRLSLRTRRFNAILSLATVLALLLSLFPFGIDLPGRLPDLGPQTASAHNLQTKFVYMFLDPATQTLLDNRISGGWVPGTPLLQVNDELGLIIKVVPRDGTTTGVGGHVDFYVPNGVTVVDVGYLLPNGSGGYVTVPMKGQSPIAIGDGPIGAKLTSQLIGLSAVGPNVLGVTENPVVSASGLHRGTLAGVYGDTGIFYSTDPDTAWGSWQSFSNAANPSEVNRCGVVGTFTLGGAKSITNNSGDVYVPCNKWDAEQAFAWGAKATTYGAAGSVPIVDYGDGRGNSPWGFAAATGGPQSGYAWNFDWDEWQASAKTAADMRSAMGNDEVGPWNRIQYPGSRISKDQPGTVSTTLGFASVDGSTVGAALPLPATTSQTDNTSPKAIRWAVGQLTDSRPEYAWVKIKVNNTAAILDASGCPVFRGDTFGGDAGGSDNGKDHLWRYYEPSVVSWNGCLGIGKPSDRAAVKSGDTFQYKIKFYNLGTLTLTNVVVSDALPSGVTFLSAVPAQNSGPNPLVWNVGTLQPGQKFESLVTVKATGSGLLDNTVTVTSSQLPPQTSTETVYSGGLALLNPSKSVSPTSVAPGGTVQYTVLVQNLGTGPSGSPVTIQEYLPAGFTFVSKDSVTVNGANVTATTTVNTSLPYSTNQPFFSIPSAINAGQSLVLVFTAQVAANASPGSYCNYYTLTQSGVPLTTGSLGCVQVGGGGIGDTVFRDWNNNGAQDSGEEGIAGVTVNLYAGSCPPSGGPIQTKVTDANGNYFFSGLTAGNYCVDAPAPGSGGVPAAYTLTTGNDPTTVTLATDEQRLNVDFGYRPGGAGSIGDKVFEDVASDGVFDGSDVGINGVTVNLYEDTNGNGVIDAGQDVLIATTTTAGGGNYSFTNLDPTRSYIVDPVDGAGSVVDTYFVNPYVATTANPNSVSPADFTAQSNAVTDADFGYFGQTPGSIGDTVCIDGNGNGLCDVGETPIPNITVWLYRDLDDDGVADPGELIDTAVTDPAGNYLFADLGPDGYLVVVDRTDPDLPGGYFPPIELLALSLTSGQNITTADFPFIQAITKSVNLATATPGQTLTYTIIPRYPGDDLLSSIVVNDTVPAGTTFLASGISPNAGGEALDTDDPADGIIDTVTWDLGHNDPGTPGYTGGTPPAACQTTTTIDASADTWINQADVGKNNGGDTTIDTSSASGALKVGLLRFAIGTTTLPAGALYNSASLNLTPTAGAGANRQIEIHSLLTSFTEGTFTNNTCSVGAAWQGPNCTDDWLSAGGNFGSSDYSASNLGTFNPTSNNTTLTADLTSTVSGWLSGGTNRGLAMVPVGSATNTVSWGTRTNGTTTFRPQIIITYTPNGCSGQTIIREAGAGEVPDSYIQEDSGGNDNYGTDNTMKVRPEATKRKHALVKFNLSGIPAGASISSATMTLNVRTAKTNQVQNVHRLLTAWVEGTSATNGVQWNDPNGTGTAGTWASGAFSASDYDAASQGTFTPSTTGNKSLNLTTLVQQWYNGTYTNNGVVLLSSGTSTADAAYASSEDGTTSRRPSLTINWAIPLGNPVGGSSISAGPSLVQGSDTITVRMTLTNDSGAAINNVSPSTLAVTGVSGANASCGGASPGVQNVPNGGSATFTWTCTASIGTTPGEVTFAASASNGTQTWSSATSNSVVVSPQLTFQATVNNPAGVDVVENQATLDTSALTVSSAPATTALTASLGDRVWSDLDGDGIQDAGEPGLAGVEVCATPTGGGAAKCDTTDANGAYRIYGLTNGGTYNVALTPGTIPAGYTATFSPTQPRTATTAGESNTDFGLRPPGTASIGDTVWLDKDEDGVKDADESGLPNITVRLYIDQNNDGVIDGGDTLLQTTTTDANGLYQFTGLHPDDYLVQVLTTSSTTTPYGVVTTIGAAMDPTFGTTNPRDVTITTAGQVVDTADFGYNWGGSIGDRLWYDNDGDEIGPAGTPGGGDAGEPYVAVGGVLSLYYDTNANGDVDPGEPIVAVALSDGVGSYLFDNLPPGNYVVKAEEQQVPAPPSSPNAGQIGVMVATTGSTHAVSLAASQDYTQADFGFIEASEMEGHVFYDVNGNGILDAGETVLPNVTVTITPPAGVDLGAGPGNPVSTTTDGDGEWGFIVPPGTYTVTYNTGDPDIPASLTQATTPVSFTVTQIAGQERIGLDFGRDNSGVIGDRVWSDPDADGVQDGGEPGLSGVTVNLYRDNNNSNTFDGGDTFLAAMTTDVSGLYQFTGLADGNYIVQVDPASLVGYTQTYDNVGGLDRVGQADISGGNTNLLVDFGFKYTLGGASLFTLSGRVYDDANNSGNDESETGFSNVTVTVVCTILGTVTAQTDATGAWSVAGVPNGDTCTVLDADETDLPRTDYAATETPSTPITVTGNTSGLDFGYNQQPGSISGTVCDGTGDGFCDDPGDSPLVLVAVSLRWAGPDGILNTADDVVTNTATNGFGNYSFTNLQPGLYQIVETNPTGYASLADADGGNPDNISQMSSSSFVLGLGENAVDRDFEDAAQDSVVGDFVWRDLDADGIQDGGELGVQGVTVELWQVGGVVPFLTTTTNASGYYSFTAPAGDYFIDFIPPVGYVLSPPDVDDGNPNPDERDSDPNIVTGRTANFTLASGANVTTWDAGLYQVDLAVDKSQQTPSNRTVFYVGEQVTFSIKITNTGESTISLLPLIDLFDNACLQYSTKAASPEESSFDNLNGIIDWNNLTVINAQYLDPNDAFTVNIPFDVVGTSLSGYNTALVEGAADVNSNNVPDQGDTVNFICVEADFGDAPQPTYPTKLDQNGARHVIVPGFYLGASVDSEPDGQPDAAATGDDLAVSDDEDGVSFGPFFPGSSTTVTVTASASGRLDAWIDFADDGSWSQAGDHIFTNQPLNAGVNVLSVPVPANATLTPQTFARFRFSSTGNLSFTGLANDGEVEDYALAIVAPASIGDFVYFDSNGNGVQDGGETTGINGVPVSLLNLGSGQTWNTVTVNGAYLFSNLPPGTYQVSVPSSQPGLVRTTPSPHVVTVVGGQNYTLADFGYIAPTGVALSSFTAMNSNDGVMVRWTTFSEEDITGFVVWRASESEGSYQSVSALIPSRGESGASYGWLDAEAGAGHTYWYKLQSQPNGQFFGPIFNQPEGGFKKLFAPMILRSR